MHNYRNGHIGYAYAISPDTRHNFPKQSSLIVYSICSRKTIVIFIYIYFYASSEDWCFPRNISCYYKWMNSIKVSIEYTHILISMLCVRQRSDLYPSGVIRKKFYGTSAHRNLLIHDTNVVSFRVKKKKKDVEAGEGKKVMENALWKSLL